MKYTTIDTRDEVTVTPAQPPAASVVLLPGSYVTLTGNIVAHLRDD